MLPELFLDLDTVSGDVLESMDNSNTTLSRALSAHNPSIRLRAALAAGSTPDAHDVDILIGQSAEESDFFVRDMLTWALTRNAPDVVFPKLLVALEDPRAQARSQALHTLSKMRMPKTWRALPMHLLHDASTDVRTAAWRVAVAVVPESKRPLLVEELRQELGRGTAETQRSLSRAFAELAEFVRPELIAVIAHARATMNLIDEPDGDFFADLESARKLANLGTDTEK